MEFKLAKMSPMLPVLGVLHDE